MFGERRKEICPEEGGETSLHLRKREGNYLIGCKRYNR